MTTLSTGRITTREDAAVLRLIVDNPTPVLSAPCPVTHAYVIVEVSDPDLDVGELNAL